MKLHDLSPAPGSKKKKLRKGRGRGARRGETAGRGTKGQKKRSNVPTYFEGGQTPIYRRLPKRGFRPPHKDRLPAEIVNISDLNRFPEAAEVTPRELLDAGLIGKAYPVKLLGDGELEVGLTVRVHAASESASRKVEKAGGNLQLLISPDDRS